MNITLEIILQKEAQNSVEGFGGFCLVGLGFFVEKKVSVKNVYSLLLCKSQSWGGWACKRLSACQPNRFLKGDGTASSSFRNYTAFTSVSHAQFRNGS